jgi:hypothetical protein
LVGDLDGEVSGLLEIIDIDNNEVSDGVGDIHILGPPNLNLIGLYGELAEVVVRSSLVNALTTTGGGPINTAPTNFYATVAVATISIDEVTIITLEIGIEEPTITTYLPTGKYDSGVVEGGHIVTLYQ